MSERTFLPRVAKFSIGDKKGDKRPGRPISYFRFAEETLADYPALTEFYHNPETGEFAPAMLRVMPPHDDPAVFASEAKLFYWNSRVACRGPVNSERLRDAQAEQWLCNQCDKLQCEHEARRHMVNVDCPCELYRGDKAQCKKTVQLQLLLPDVTLDGVFQVDSHIMSMLNLRDNLKWIRNLCGRLAFVPMKLTLKPKVSFPGGKKTTNLVLNLAFDGTMADAERIRAGTGTRFSFAPLQEEPAEPEEDTTEPDEPAPDLDEPQEPYPPAPEEQAPDEPPPDTDPLDEPWPDEPNIPEDGAETAQPPQDANAAPSEPVDPWQEALRAARAAAHESMQRAKIKPAAMAECVSKVLMTHYAATKLAALTEGQLAKVADKASRDKIDWKNGHMMLETGREKKA